MTGCNRLRSVRVAKKFIDLRCFPPPWRIACSIHLRRALVWFYIQNTMDVFLRWIETTKNSFTEQVTKRSYHLSSTKQQCPMQTLVGPEKSCIDKIVSKKCIRFVISYLMDIVSYKKFDTINFRCCHENILVVTILLVLPLNVCLHLRINQSFPYSLREVQNNANQFENCKKEDWCEL